MTEDRHNCWIYRSSRQQELYLYLAVKDNFDRVPADLIERFGRPELVMELELSPERTLAREDVLRVMDNLKARGYHIQLPPKIDARLYWGD